ncbi:MAG: NHLP leader peptide family RiPP precursor [Candidatus Ozemobacteraceae bacterium]
MIAKVWADQTFKEKLIAEPRKVLEAEGIKVPEGVEVKVVEQTDKTIYFVIPKAEGGSVIEDLGARDAAY